MSATSLPNSFFKSLYVISVSSINSETVKNLAKNFKGKIVFLSTCSVYGAQEGILDESSEVNPLSEYASSKLIAEKYLADSDSIIFRLGTLFGIGDNFSFIFFFD